MCILLIILLIATPFIIALWPKGPHFEAVEGNSPILLWKANNTMPDSVTYSATVGKMNPGSGSEVVTTEETWGSVGNRTIQAASCITLLRGDTGEAEWSYQFDTRGISDVALGDLDADGYSEMVFTVDGIGIIALKGNGSMYWECAHAEIEYIHFQAPIIADVLGNSKPEVIIAEGNNILILNGTTGHQIWSIDLSIGYASTAAIGDINGDNKPEIVVNSENDFLYAFNAGNETPLWLHRWTHTRDWMETSTPIIADINRDGKIDVIVSTTEELTALNGADGSVLWQHLKNSNDFSWSLVPPAIGDLDGDGQLEVVDSQNSDQLYAVHGRDGSMLWTYSGFYEMYFLSVGDFDGDNGNEIIISGAGSGIAAINAEDASNAWYYNYDTPSEFIEFQYAPAVGDVNGNGKLDIVVPGASWHIGLSVYTIEPLSSGDDLYWNDKGGAIDYTHTQCLHDIDSDFDGLSDFKENEIGTNASSYDSDGDTIPDAWEYHHGFDPTDASVSWNEMALFNSTLISIMIIGVASVSIAIFILKKIGQVMKKDEPLPPDISNG